MNQLARILAEHPHVLLDFDGPICGACEGVTDRWLADHLRATLAGRGCDLPWDIAATPDPFAVLRYSVRLGPDVPATLDLVFVELEQVAVRVAPATPGSAEAIRRPPGGRTHRDRRQQQLRARHPRLPPRP